MILSAIFHFLKMILGLAVKVIAWLLVSLSLWVPLLYTIVFVIACAFSGSSLSALKNWYFAGLALSFIGSFAISNYIYGRQLKNKKREKKPKGNIEKIKAAEPTPEIVKTEEQLKPQPEVSPISEPAVAGRSIIQEAIAESEATFGREHGENIVRGEIRSKNETAVKHGFFSYGTPANNPAQGDTQNSVQGNGGEGKGFVGGGGAHEYTQDAGAQYKSGQDILYRELGGDFGRRDSLFSGGFSEPPVSGGGYQGGFQEGYGARNNYNATGFSSGNNTQPNYNKGNSYNPQANYQDGFSAGNNSSEQGFSVGNNPQAGYNKENYSPQTNYAENNYNKPAGYQNYNPQDNYHTGNKFSQQDNAAVKFSEQNNDNSITQQNTFNSGNNYSVQDSYSGYESYNAFDTPISGGFETRAQAYEPSSQGFESRSQAYQPDSQRFESRSQSLGTPISGGGFEEQPKIFASRNDPTVFIYEYSDRLDYYKRTRSGMIFMHSRPKAANG